MVNELGKVKFCNISIEIFQVEIDNQVFGLKLDHESKSVLAQPSSTMSFYEPWDGEYYT